MKRKGKIFFKKSYPVCDREEPGYRKLVPILPEVSSCVPIHVLETSIVYLCFYNISTAKMSRYMDTTTLKRDRSPSPRYRHQNGQYSRSKSRSRSRSRSSSKERCRNGENHKTAMYVLMKLLNQLINSGK